MSDLCPGRRDSRRRDSVLGVFLQEGSEEGIPDLTREDTEFPRLLDEGTRRYREVPEGSGSRGGSPHRRSLRRNGTVDTLPSLVDGSDGG